MSTYVDLFGAVPQLSHHEIRRMNQRDISVQDLMAALATHARPGTSPGTIEFVANRVTVVVDEIDGTIITSWRT